LIRGHIDFASRTLIEGWLYSEHASLNGATVLAFVGDSCVGAGTIHLFRQDLADVGYGDGICGFSFSVFLTHAQDQRDLEIRLDNSNLSLLQANIVRGTRSQMSHEVAPNPDATKLAWMRSKGWLAESHHNILRMLSQFGMAEVSVPKKLWPKGEAPEINADELLKHMSPVIDAAIQQSAQIHAMPLNDLATLQQLRMKYKQEFPKAAPIVGLWCPKPAILHVQEGSYLTRQEGMVDDVAAASHMVGGVEHEMGGMHGLFLNLDNAIAFREGKPPVGSVLVVATNL
jgi:hypothetical protein